MYCLDPYKFILVPYFSKKKQLYDKKVFLALTDENGNSMSAIDISTNKKINVKSLSKWTCEVNLLKQSQVYPNGNDEYKLFYILRNELNETIVKDIPSQRNYGLRFILEDEYIALEKEKQLKKDELLAKKKKEEQQRIEKERIVKQKHYQYCINKFGQLNGNIIAQGKVKIGMSKEMCKVAWGKPFDIYKTTTKYGISETWYYSWKYSLQFEDGLLAIIEN